jgi:hypothetical protein
MTDHAQPHKLPGQGKSSFDLIDPAALWAELNLSPGIAFTDLGCGQGNYALDVAKIVGPHRGGLRRGPLERRHQLS